ncbi:MAG TPA: LytTR family DNA-binding domain-containing protein [Bacteroidales bacterium]|nr:LytTR family DNA-binding domain-containing protein [Bacteroidales bacterium]
MNCIIIDDDKLSRKVVEEFIQKTESLELTGSFSNAPDAIQFLKQNDQTNLIFLDIEMPDMSGLDFLDTMKKVPQIIIMSSKGKYALNAFEYDVTDYLLKPIQYARFYKAIDKAMNRMQRNSIAAPENEEIFIRKNSALVKLKCDDILFVEALENYVIFNTQNEKYTIHFTMKLVEQKLPSNKFVRVHRSYIVNSRCFNEIEDNSIIITTGEGRKIIPIGKSYRDNLMNALNLISK